MDIIDIEKKYSVYRWVCIYPDDADLMAENLNYDEANTLAKKLNKENKKCNVCYLVQQQL